MITVVLVVHLLLATALVAVILLQRSEGGALGGLGGGNFGGLMTARGSANLLTRATAILAACFVLTSLGLAILASRSGGERRIFDAPASGAPAPAVPAQGPAPAPGATPPAEPSGAAPGQPAPAPSAPSEPTAPLAR